MEKEWPGKWEDIHKRMALHKVKIEKGSEKDGVLCRVIYHPKAK